MQIKYALNTFRGRTPNWSMKSIPTQQPSVPSSSELPRKDLVLRPLRRRRSDLLLPFPEASVPELVRTCLRTLFLKFPRQEVRADLFHGEDLDFEELTGRTRMPKVCGERGGEAV